MLFSRVYFILSIIREANQVFKKGNHFGVRFICDLSALVWGPGGGFDFYSSVWGISSLVRSSLLQMFYFNLVYLLAHNMGSIVSYVLSTVIIHILLGSYFFVFGRSRLGRVILLCIVDWQMGNSFHYKAENHGYRKIYLSCGLELITSSPPPMRLKTLY